MRDNSWLKQTFLQAVTGGAERAEIHEWVQGFVERILAKEVRPGARDTIRRHKGAGHHLIMVTASLDFYVEELGKRLGFDTVICTRSAWDAGERLTGYLDGDNCYGAVKLELVNEYFRQKRSHSQWYTLGYSDHHSDLPLLSWVDEAIAVNPTGKLLDIAKQRGYEIQDWDVN
jgi:HAD superfamily hydrolase (TIGR01490 family)